MSRTGAFSSVLALGAVLVLAACGEAEAPAPQLAANEDCAPGIEVTDGWMALPAVAGNAAAVYFTIRNTNDQTWTIRGVDMIGAQSAMLHETAEWSRQEDMQELFQQPVEPGESVTFAPGGKHVMVMGPSADLAAGGTSEVTITSVRGDKCSFPVAIRAPGDAPPAAEGGAAG